MDTYDMKKVVSKVAGLVYCENHYSAYGNFKRWVSINDDTDIDRLTLGILFYIGDDVNYTRHKLDKDPDICAVYDMSNKEIVPVLARRDYTLGGMVFYVERSSNLSVLKEDLDVIKNYLIDAIFKRS